MEAANPFSALFDSPSTLAAAMALKDSHGAEVLRLALKYAKQAFARGEVRSPRITQSSLNHAAALMQHRLAAAS